MSAEIPVAIIGLGGKFPGGSDTPALFYEFLRNKGDGMIEPPADRWVHAEFMGGKDEPGKYHTAKAGFVSDIDMFDPLEFGISVKEAPHFDAAIRLTLEASHQALQDSGIDYRGSKTGVYFGNLLTTTFELDEDRYEINSYNGIGRCVSIRANRISFTFDLRGPSLTVDTACSASATAMHLALSAIRNGEIDQALVVGANTMINPEHTVSFSKLGVLSPTGSSKPFDAAADGYARAEAVAAVVIKRQDLAECDGDLSYAVITGSSINANGKGKSLTMPEGVMQAETVQGAYAIAKRDPAEAFYVELHATGTKVGDPIEANAAGRVFSVNRPVDRTLRIGSVKSNIGHTEGCSFLASLVKVSMMLHRKEIIPNVRFNNPNPGIDFIGGKMKVQVELEKITPEMIAEDGKLVASVSSYGVGGSNAHIVLESSRAVCASELTGTPSTSAAPVAQPLYLFAIGSLTEATLARWKKALGDYFVGVTDDRTMRSLSYHLARQSRAYPARSYAVAPSLTPDTQFSKYVLTNDNKSPKLCLVFSGQGPQHIFMGRQLAADYPVFLSAIQENDRILVDRYGQSSMLARTGLFVPGVEAALASNGAWPVNEVVLSLVFVQIALVDLLRSLGIRYDCVVGHSLGEIAMGYASGHYTREMAVGLAVARATAMIKAEGNGSMAALGVGVQKAKTMIRKILRRANVGSGLWIAGINSPEAVTVAGKHELIDMLIAFAKDPAHPVFAAKLRVGCAFHTPLMEEQEKVFKEQAGDLFTNGTGNPIARVMSTNDGGWLERDLDLNYCWDNIRRPVLFGTAIKKLVDEEGDNGLLFLEIAPHPVLKSYVDQCGGQAISLIRRPNPKLPDGNTTEPQQLLEGIGELLCAGFKGIDLRKLCAPMEGVPADSGEDFIRVTLPDYPYNKTRCWAESGSERSLRLYEKQRPLAPAHFRINVDTHPDLAGHVIFDAPLFPASGYIESILEHGAMVVQNINIHRPLVLKGHATTPTHAGCIIDGDRWQFRASTLDEFDNGAIKLDTLYASGTFSPINPGYRADSVLSIDVSSRLDKSVGSVTGDEFYAAIPPAYQYKGHFRDYLTSVHEVNDEDSWGGKAYLARLDVAEDAPYVFGNDYVIHPGVLDSIIQCGLATFVNTTTKLFDFGSVLLPVKIDAFRRWDSADAPNLDSQIKKGVWAYFTARTWAPQGPFVSDCIVTNSQGHVLFTMEGLEMACAPGPDPIAISDESVEARLTTIWQPKSLPACTALPLDGLLFSGIFDSIIKEAAKAGRRVFRVLDLDNTLEIAQLLDCTLSGLLQDGLLVEYHCAGTSSELGRERVASMQYSHVRPVVMDALTCTELPYGDLASFDIILDSAGGSVALADVAAFGNLLAPNGMVLLSSPDASISDSSLPLLKSLESLGGSPRVATWTSDERHVIAVQINCPSNSSENVSNTVVICPFVHGEEGELVHIVSNLTAESELWITGNDDASGIGALGVAACVIAESPEFEVHSVLFEDHFLSQEERENVIYEIRRQPSLMEQHMKISTTGEVYVRRLVHGSRAVRDRFSYDLDAARGLQMIRHAPSCKLPAIEVDVDIVALHAQDPSSLPCVFVGTVCSARGEGGDHRKVVGVALETPTKTLVTTSDALTTVPVGMCASDAATVSLQMLQAWIGLKSVANTSPSSRVLIHGGATATGRAAIRLCEYLDASYTCTVESSEEAESIVKVYGTSRSAVLLRNDYRTAAAISRAGVLTAIFDCSEDRACSLGTDKLSAIGWYIRLQKDGQHDNSAYPHAPLTFNLDIKKLLEQSPEIISSAMEAILAAHQSRSFDLAYPSPLNRPHETDAAADQVLVMPPTTVVKASPTDHLFDPRRSYILIGGCSELGVRLTHWMVTSGARHVFLTSRRGAAGLSTVDHMYLEHLRLSGAEVEAIAADAVSKEATLAVIERATQAGEIAGIFLMTVVLRDAKFTNLTQQAFDDVRRSKVDVLSTLLECLDPAKLDFLLLFSTIGSVFGNAGQAAYCASQLYLDRIADLLPNTISISLPPITDSGVFKRLVMSTKGLANTQQLSKTGMTTAQVCNFIGDCLVRTTSHYVPMLAIDDVPDTFSSCEPLLYSHLLPRKTNDSHESSADSASAETPTSLLAGLLGLDASQISANALITSFGLDSLGATRYSNLLKSRFGIRVSQIELLGSMSVGKITEMLSGHSDSLDGESGSKEDDGSVKYGAPLLPILSGKLAFDEPYTTDASPHQHRIWLSQREHDITSTDSSSSLGRQALHWDTHEGYTITIHFEEEFSPDRLEEALQEMVQRHGALRTGFSWNDRLSKLQQTVFPSADLQLVVHDLSSEPNASAKAHELSMLMHEQPNFSLESGQLIKVAVFNLGGGDWALTLVVHHIIIDEASVVVFFSELLQLYANGPGGLPDLNVHYSDFSDWIIRTSHRRSELREEQLTFWRELLGDVESLHCDLATPSEAPLTSITQIDTRIDAGVLEHFRAAVKDANATSFAAFFAVYNVLLHKYSNQTTFAVGTAVTQRSIPALSSVIGMFANVLPIKTTIEEDETFSDYLLRFKDALIQCLANSDVGYEEVVAHGKASAHERGYFKHLFALGGFDAETVWRLQLDSIRGMSAISLPNHDEGYEMLLTVHPQSGKVVLRFDRYSYTEAAARQFLNAYVTLVGTLAENSKATIRDTCTLDRHEYSRLVNDVAVEREVSIVETCLHHLFEEQVRRTPSLTAVEFEDDSRTYQQLNNQANYVARILLEQGIGHGDMVALCFDRGIHQVLSALSVLKSGACFVPLDPDDPLQRRLSILEDCRVRVILTTSDRAASIEGSFVVLCVDDLTEHLSVDEVYANAAMNVVRSDSVAYVMFTSGSTGKPKGVEVEHRSICNLVLHSEIYGFKQGARVLSSLSYTFDPFIVDVFGTLCKGGTLVTDRKEMVLGNISAALVDLRINVLHITPSILSTVPPKDYPHLETVVVAGEELPKKLIDEWSNRVMFMNMYGPTEASVDCISCRVVQSTAAGVIGRPLPNNRIYILDKHLRPVPVGVEGSLYIGGIQLARGYLNRPELTAQAFITNPFIPGERIYKTGDIALYLSDGNIQYRGREDRQIKLRGQRLDLGAVEDVISRYKSVQRCAVVIRTVHGVQLLVAFVEFNKESRSTIEDDTDALKWFIKTSLPRFMNPSIIIPLPVLPTSTSGKISRKTLLDIDLEAHVPCANDENVPPSSNLESELLFIFARLVKISPSDFGVTRDLFSLGMTSLMAVQAAGAIFNAFGVNVSLRQIYLRPTVRELSELIADMTGGRSTPQESVGTVLDVLPVKKTGIEPTLFFIHDITGIATPAMHLAPHLANKIYAIQDCYFGSPKGFESVDAMAGHYVSLVTNVQPTGPLVLCGHSFGGLVVLSMARRLVAAGREIQHVILLDTVCIPFASRQRLLQPSGDWQQTYVDRFLGSQNAAAAEMTDEWRRMLESEMKRNMSLMLEHEPERWESSSASSITLIVPEDRSWYITGVETTPPTGIPSAASLGEDNGWKACLGRGVRVRTTAGRHDTMVTSTNAGVLAGVLGRVLLHGRE